MIQDCTNLGYFFLYLSSCVLLFGWTMGEAGEHHCPITQSPAALSRSVGPTQKHRDCLVSGLFACLDCAAVSGSSRTYITWREAAQIANYRRPRILPTQDFSSTKGPTFRTMSPMKTIIGSWHSVTASTSQIIDLEAQTTVQGTHTSLPESISTPFPTHSLRHSITGTDPVDDFFGVTPPSTNTRDSRHDLRLSAGELPPPYPDLRGELPAYDAAPVEPITLAMYLFKFGFCTSVSFTS